MTREDMMQLLREIRIFYQRFDAVEKVDGEFRVSTTTADAWLREIGYLSLDEAMKILDKHMESDQGNKTPTVNTFKTGGRSAKNIRCTAVLERGRIRWEPEPDKVYELRVTWDSRAGAWRDEDGRLWAEPEVTA